METSVQLVYRGEVLQGFARDEVQRGLGRALKLDESRVARLFSGKRVVIKRAISPADAQRYVAQFARLGARLHVESSEAAAPRPGPAPLRPAPAPRAVSSMPPLPDLPPLPPLPPPSQLPPMSQLPPLSELPPLTEFPPVSDLAPPPVQARPVPTPPRRPPPTPERKPERAPDRQPALQMAPLGDKPLELSLATEETITCPNCGEVQSKRVLCRSCTTNMPMGIAAKIEAEQQARAERLEAWRIKRGLATPAEAPDGDAPGLWGLGFSGRMGRLAYLSGNLVLVGVCWLLVVQMLSSLALAAQAGRGPDWGRLAACGIVLLIGMAQGIRLVSLRLQDLNLTPWLALGSLLPYLNVLLSLGLSFWPGTRGENDYGGPARPGRWAPVGVSLLVCVVCLGLSVPGMKAVAGAVPDWAALASMAGPAAGTLPALPSEAARAAYREQYAPAAAHKAFAVAPDGSWGWAASASSMPGAIRDAMARCEEQRRGRGDPCVPVDVNGHNAEQEGG